MTTHLWLRRTIALACVVALALGTALPAVASSAWPAQAPKPTATPKPSGDYVPISDNSGVLSMEVPASWTDVEETEWTMDDEPVGTKVAAAPSLDDFYSSWDVPGVVLSYSESLPQEMSVEDLLDTIDYSENCEEGERDDLPEGELVGMYQIWGNCDGTTTAAIAVLTPADSPDYYVLVEIYAVDEGDLDAMEHIIDTLTVGSTSQTDEPVVNTTTDSPLLDSVDTSDLIYEYVELKDPAIVAVVPKEYEEINAAVWKSSEGDPLGYTLTAAPNIQEFNDTWTTPGMLINSAIDLGESFDPDEILANDSLAESCTYDDRYTDEREVDGVTYQIDYDWYNNCGETDSSYVAGLAQTDPADMAIFFDFLIADKADEEAFDVFLQTFSLDRELAAAAPTDSTAGDDTQPDTSAGPTFVDVVDDTGTISLRVPEAWTDTRSEEWDLGDGPIGSAFYAAPDVDAFNDNMNEPGVFVGVSEEMANSFSPDEALDVLDFSDSCTYDDRYDYESASLVGVYDVWTDCDELEGDNFIVLGANPVDETSPLLLLYINLPMEDDAVVFDEIVNSLAVAGAVDSAEATRQEALLDQPLAVVEVNSLNIRSGPGTNYNRVGVANQGDALAIQGQLDNCDWLQVTTADGIEGWASGKEQYVTLDTRCVDIPEAERPAPPAAAASSSDQGGARSGQNEGNAAAGSQAANSSQGCYLFQNQLGAEVTITVTRSDTGKGTTFKVAGGAEVEKCFDPGRYTYTMDAPPPWNSINGDLEVQAGDAFLWPISGE